MGDCFTPKPSQNVIVCPFCHSFLNCVLEVQSAGSNPAQPQVKSVKYPDDPMSEPQRFKILAMSRAKGVVLPEGFEQWTKGIASAWIDANTNNSDGNGNGGVKP